MGIELVRWQDAHFVLDEKDEEEGDYIVETVGWVTVVGSWVRIVHEQLPSGGEDRGITRVLRDNVVDRIRLTSVREGPRLEGPHE